MTAETGGVAGTNRNPHEQTSDSSETEVSNDGVEDDDDVTLGSELSDSRPETGDRDNDWIENRSSESDVKTVNKSFSCHEGGKQFVHKWSLQKHVRVTSCSAVRSSEFLLNKKCARVKKHVDSCRKVQEELNSISCDDCGNKFSVKSTLNRHMRVHTGLNELI
nr:gastrula zinc finger protein xFG20-1-like [Nothobranchius furzeri]